MKEEGARKGRAGWPSSGDVCGSRRKAQPTRERSMRPHTSWPLNLHLRGQARSRPGDRQKPEGRLVGEQIPQLTQTGGGLRGAFQPAGPWRGTCTFGGSRTEAISQSRTPGRGGGGRITQTGTHFKGRTHACLCPCARRPCPAPRSPPPSTEQCAPTRCTAQGRAPS